MKIILNIRTQITFVAVLFSLIISFESCKAESRQLAIGILPDVDSIPLLIAEKEGYFTEEGVDVKIERFSSPVNRDTSFQTGNIDGAVSDLLAALLALNGGFDVRIGSMTNGSYKLLASSGSGITDAAGISGKSVAMSLNTIIEYSTDRIASAAGLAEGGYEKTVIPQIPVRLEMLKAGKVDAATLPEPLASAAAASGAVIIDSSDRHDINPGVLLFSAAALNKKGKEIKLFYKAYNRAVTYLNETDTAVIEDFLIKEGGFPESVRGALRLPEYTAASLPGEKEFNEVRSWLENKGLIKGGFLYSTSCADVY